MTQTMLAPDGETEIAIGKLDIDEDTDPRSGDGDGGGTPPRFPPPPTDRRDRGRKPDRPPLWQKLLLWFCMLVGVVLLIKNEADLARGASDGS
jgi:hypothetical protein